MPRLSSLLLLITVADLFFLPMYTRPLPTPAPPVCFLGIPQVNDSLIELLNAAEQGVKGHAWALSDEHRAEADARLQRCMYVPLSLVPLPHLSFMQTCPSCKHPFVPLLIVAFLPPCIITSVIIP